MKLRLFALLAAGSLVLAACGSDDPTVPDPSEVVESVEDAVGDAVDDSDLPPVATVDNSFAPSMLAASFGEELTVTVVNNGQNPHSFTIDAIDVDTGVLQPGESAEVTFAMPDQDVEYYCTVHGAEVMSGTLSVAG